ncbi:CsbD family protein [Hansschlegelia beijingensis]|uniref:CsbD family protein n=1 Tax=Hansschlegelia beijingensis TaxID=1133344 RepID=UPI0038298396
MVNKNTVKGAAKEAVGKTKEAAGKATGDRELEGKGKGEAAAGKVQKAVGKATTAVKSAVK